MYKVSLNQGFIKSHGYCKMFDFFFNICLPVPAHSEVPGTDEEMALYAHVHCLAVLYDALKSQPP